MRLLPATATLLASALATLAAAQAPACTSTCVRREFRTLTADQRSAYFAALAAIMTSGVYDQFTAWHLEFQTVAHNAPLFLPWHRAMMRRFELALQAVDPSVCLHYWAWEMDANAPEASPVFAADAYGSGPTNCLSTPWMPANRGSCTTRQWGQGGRLGAMPSPENVNNLVVQGSSFEAFREPFEYGPHAIPHITIGGDMATMRSPNDPIFYAHHANVDRWYHIWQQANPSVANTFPSASSATLAPFDLTIDQVFNIANLCYSYEEMTVATATAAGLMRRDLASLHRRQAPEAATIAAPPQAQNDSVPDMGVPHFNITHNRSDHYNAYDRGNLRALRYVTHIPGAYIHMMGFDEATVRAYEADMRRFVERLNDVKGYVSPVALCRRHELLGHLVANATHEYYVDVDGERVSVPIDAGSVDQAVQRVNQAAPGTVAGGPQVEEGVRNIAGPWKGNPLSADNFELAAKGGETLADTPELEDDQDQDNSEEASTASRTSLAAATLALAATLAAMVLH